LLHHPCLIAVRLLKRDLGRVASSANVDSGPQRRRFSHARTTTTVELTQLRRIGERERSGEGYRGTRRPYRLLRKQTATRTVWRRLRGVPIPSRTVKRQWSNCSSTAALLEIDFILPHVLRVNRPCLVDSTTHFYHKSVVHPLRWVVSRVIMPCLANRTITFERIFRRIRGKHVHKKPSRREVDIIKPINEA
jgi:hypothetical protein